MRTFQRTLSLLLMLCLISALWMGTAALAASPEEALPDPYIYYFAPNSDLIPSYYSFYAKPAVCNSPHYVAPSDTAKADATYLFNMVNVTELIWDEAQSPEGGYATINGFCADRATPIVVSSSYRKLNLEDAYFCITEEGTEDLTAARGIRAVMHHTWPYVEDVDQIVEAANAYLKEQYGDDAVLVQDLTGAELLAASQAAIWHYSNNEDFANPTPYNHTVDFDSWGPFFCDYYYPQMMYLDGFVNIREKQRDVTATNIGGIYDYLVNLPGEAASDRVITEDSLSLVGAIQTGEDMMLLVSIDGTVDSNDQLTLTAGSQSWELSGSEVRTLSQGVYALCVAAEDFSFGDQLVMTLTGTQTVEDVVFLEAKPVDGSTPRESSQNVVAYSDDSAPVGALLTGDLPLSRKLEITKVDANSQNPLPGVTFDLYVKLEGEAVKLNTLTTDENGKIAVYVADDDNEYYFVETETLPGYEAEGAKVSEGIVTNTMSTGSLTVSKKVINTTEAQAHEQFNFRLTLDLSTAPVAGSGLSWLTAEYLTEQIESTQKLDWTVAEDGTLTAEFTLKADGSITLSEIPLGTTYQLEEILTAKDRLVYSVTTKIDDGAAQKSTTAEGSIAQQNAVLYTNTLHEEANPQTGDTLLPLLALLLLALPLALIPLRKLQ